MKFQEFATKEWVRTAIVMVALFIFFWWMDSMAVKER